MPNFINQMEPWFGEEERLAVNEYMGAGGWLTEFRKTQEFEQMICDYTGSKYCFAVNNGTVSLTLAALACSLKAGDEVIVPNYTMIATPNSMKIFGANPIFVDVEEDTLCLDYSLVKEAITEKTKAIMLVTANGRYPKCGIEAFVKLAKDRNLVLIEDAAQSLGSFYSSGKHMGSVGDVGSFSFSAPKVISTGQGGAIITNDEEIAHRLGRLKDFGRSGGGNDVHDTIGYNFKFTDIQATIGIEQMKKLHWRVERKRNILKLYKKKLQNVKQIKFFKQDLKITTPWFIDVLAEKRDDLMIHLKDKGIGNRMMYPPINKQKSYSVQGEYPVSNLVGKKGLWLPSASQLSDENINFICEKIGMFYMKQGKI
jgi:perosamine synthetase